MSDYKDIIGTHIKTVTTDPPNPENGQMWYNSTTKVVKGFVSNPAGSWATGGTVNTARQLLGAAGTQTNSLIFGGSPPNPAGALTESWNGSSWTEVNDLNAARNGPGGAGTYTSALAFGGEPAGQDTESWNGSSWTEVADLNAVKTYAGSCGADNTSALFFGGGDPAAVATNELWNGSSWTEVGDLNQKRNFGAGSGIATAALYSTGRDSPPNTNNVANNESWNGSTWTEVGDVNTARRITQSSASGTNTSTLVFGGYTTTHVAVTELWNGSSFSETVDMSTARYGSGGHGTSTAAMISTGNAAPGVTTATEEFTSPATSTVTFTTS